VSSESTFKLNHPAIMGTGVYLDDSGVIDMSGSKTIGQDVRFLSTLCWIWWPGGDKNNVKTGKSDELYNAECIDGETGMIHCYEDSDLGMERRKDDADYSAVSTFALTNLYLKIDGILNERGNAEDNTKSMSRGGIDKLSLEGLRALKWRASPTYESNKDSLLQKHKVFIHWNRRQTVIPLLN